MSKTEKLLQINKLYVLITDELFLNFFDINSESMLDEKIEVMKKLANGVSPIDIKNYYKVLELYPKDNNVWDI